MLAATDHPPQMADTGHDCARYQYFATKTSHLKLFCDKNVASRNCKKHAFTCALSDIPAHTSLQSPFMSTITSATGTRLIFALHVTSCPCTKGTSHSTAPVVRLRCHCMDTQPTSPPPSHITHKHLAHTMRAIMHARVALPGSGRYAPFSIIWNIMDHPGGRQHVPVAQEQ